MSTWQLTRDHDGEKYRTTVHGATDEEIERLVAALRELHPNDTYTCAHLYTA